MADRKKRVITLRLEHPEDMFLLAQTDLFTEYRNHLTGVELALSELRSREIRAGVELHIVLPTSELSDDLDLRMTRALKRYCDERIRYNSREKRATRLDGTTALRIGLPVTAFGLVITFFNAKASGNDGVDGVLDHLGWVFAWIGLWWPLDAILFSPHVYSRENRALTALRDATIVIEPSGDLSATGSAE